MRTDEFLTLKETAELLANHGYPVTRYTLRNSFCRGKGPPCCVDARTPGAKETRLIRPQDALEWAEQRYWPEPRIASTRGLAAPKAVEVDDPEMDRILMCDQIIWYLRLTQGKSFDRAINRIPGPLRRNILNQIAFNALNNALTELLDVIEREIDR